MYKYVKQILAIIFSTILFFGVFVSSASADNYGEGKYGGWLYGAKSLTASGPTSCTDSVPGGYPWLTTATAKSGNSIELSFNKASDPVTHYVLQYGVKSGEYIWGADNIGGKDTASYLVSELQPNTTYFFRVRASNGCATGAWSNEISAKTKGLISFNQLDIVESELEPTTPSTYLVYTVKSGDNLWSIAASELGDGSRYTEIIECNQEIYPSLVTSSDLRVGWELKISCPASDGEEELQEGYVVNVKVTDTKQEPIEGAKVTIHSKVQEATTNAAGVARFENVEAGEHQVSITYNNYEGEQGINLSGDAREYNLNITVQQKNVLTSPLVMAIVGGLGLIILVLVVLLIKARK